MMEFQCLMCHQMWLIDHYAFSLRIDDELHAVCGDCAEEGL
jgi:hypothetical protein